MAKLSEAGFRDIYHRICCLSMNDCLRNCATHLQMDGALQATGVLAYGYIDTEAGITFEILCCVTMEDYGVDLFDSAQTSIKVRRSSLLDCEFAAMDDSVRQRFEGRLQIIDDTYTVPFGVYETRGVRELDGCRHEDFPDDVLVYLYAEGKRLEGCWVRCMGLSGRRIIGKLLNQPDQDFGIRRGDQLTFDCIRTDDRIICVWMQRQ